MQAALRVDAAISIGTGHVMRCLALAEAFTQAGIHCTFYCKNHPGHLAELIRSREHALVMLSPPNQPLTSDSTTWLGCDWQEDFKELTGLISRMDILVVDHYGIPREWEQSVIENKNTGALVVIDDLANRAHRAHLLVDQNPDPARGDIYAGLVPPNCRVLLGGDYALLRGEFLSARQRMPPRTCNVSRVIVAFGGVDAEGATRIALLALQRALPPDIAVDVVVGSRCPHLEEIIGTCRQRGYSIHIQTNRMAELMVQADLYIGAAGATTWERCCLGLPGVVVATADNQEALATHLASQGIHVYLGKIQDLELQTLQEAVKDMLAPSTDLSLMSAAASLLCDGKGCRRIAEIVTSMVKEGEHL